MQASCCSGRFVYACCVEGGGPGPASMLCVRNAEGMQRDTLVPLAPPPHHTLHPQTHGCRGYSASKIQENVQCEIMMVILEDARECYK